jgi:hypothetical protein
MARSRMIDAALCALACALTGSCVDDSVSVRIDCVVPPSADCTYAGTGELCRSQGALNLGATRSYFAGLRVVNGLRARARTSPPLAEPNGLSVSGFDVKIMEPSGATYNFGGLPNPFFAPTSGWAAPGGGKFPAGAELIPDDYGAVLQKNEANARTKVGSLLVEVSVRGVTDGNVDVESASISYPVTMFFASADFADGECLEAKGTICLPGQDADAVACNPSTLPE